MCVLFKKYLSNPRSHRFSPMFSFIVLAPTFRSMIHFELIFVCDVRWRLKLFFFCTWILITPVHLMKRLCFSHDCLCIFVKIQLIMYVWIYFWTLFCSIDPHYLSVYQHYNVFIILTLHWVLKSGSISQPTWFFSFKIVLTILGSQNILHFYINFRINLSISTKKPADLLINFSPIMF